MLADPNFDKKEEVDFLLGVEALANIDEIGYALPCSKGLLLRERNFGWVIYGNAGQKSVNAPASCLVLKGETIESQLEQSSKLEETSCLSVQKIEDHDEDLVRKSTSRHKGACAAVKAPCENTDNFLGVLKGNSFGTAGSRERTLSNFHPKENFWKVDRRNTSGSFKYLSNVHRSMKRILRDHLIQRSN